MKNYFEASEYKKVIFYICIFLFIAMILTRFQKDNMIEKRLNYYKTNYRGRITFVEGVSRGQTEIALNSARKKLVIYLGIDSSLFNGKEYFYQLAQVGDSISKPAYSDTIYLYRKDTVMSIYFNKDLN